jgi:hypothetical protein
MSISCDCRVVVGVALSEIYSFEIKDGKRTKYNPDTGKPYQESVKRLHGKFGNSVLPPVVFEKKEYSWTAEARQDWEFIEDEGLDVFLTSWSGGGDPNYVKEHGVVGIRLCSGDSDRNGSALLEDATKAAEKVKNVLAKYGYTGPVLIYSQLTWG